MKRGALISDSVGSISRKIRLLLIVLCLFLVCGSIMFALIDKTSLFTGLVSTLQALAFIYEASSVGAQVAQVFVAVLGAVIFWWVVWSLFDIIASEHFFELLRSKYIEWRVTRMKNHIVIAGGGRVGTEVATRLLEQKAQYVVVENDAKCVKDLKAQGVRVLFGDASIAHILSRANIAQAKSLVLTLPSAEKNLLVALLAKELNPNILIHARADSDEYLPLLKKAGVSFAVIPEVAAAEQLLQSLQK